MIGSQSNLPFIVFNGEPSWQNQKLLAKEFHSETIENVVGAVVEDPYLASQTGSACLMLCLICSIFS